MDAKKKKQVLEILDYWKIIEFLGQVDLPSDSLDNKKIIERIKKGQPVAAEKVELFAAITDPNHDIEDIIEKDSKIYAQFPTIGNEIFYCIGEVGRNDCVEYLSKYIANREEMPELAYPQKSAITWGSFKTDTEGSYVKNSFQFSPLMWALSIWEKSKTANTLDFSLNTNAYDDIILGIDKELEGENVKQFLGSLHNKLYREYVKSLFPEIKLNTMGLCIYSRYASDENKEKDKGQNDYSDLGKSYYRSDIILMAGAIKSGKFGDKSEYQQKVISYILSAYEKSEGIEKESRISISPKESKEKMYDFFEEVLNVVNAPLGKWPAKFMPALMQQIAVNLAIDKNGDAPIFSVNGPPGTGKTTLLKEIVANNIVERAILLANASEDDPDAAFEKRSFTQGPLTKKAYYEYAPYYYVLKNDQINQYGMLVASCNNAAVENITIDLPKSGDILGSLESSKDDGEQVSSGLAEIHDLFDVACSTDIENIKRNKKVHEEKDIYFTRYANKLFKKDDCWGLISAPFGKKDNINKYCDSVLKPFLEDYNANIDRESHKQKYKEQRILFLRQLELVEKLQTELELISQAEQATRKSLGYVNKDQVAEKVTEIEEKLRKIDARIKLKFKDIMELEESQPKGFFSKMKQSSTRTELIHQYQEELKQLQYEKASMESFISKTEELNTYQKLLDRYSSDECKMVPIGNEFIEDYLSQDEKRSTSAQVTNPWFTAKYNREREKLFLSACKLNKEFVIASKSFKQDVINLLISWDRFDDCSERMSDKDRNDAFPAMLQSIFLLTPVVSTTFASAQTFLKNIKEPGMLGTLIVDEAGQAPPQMALGTMFRCRKAIIVGDPKQIEPVVTAETDMIKQLLSSPLLQAYKDKRISVQGCADYINQYGTYLGEGDEREWVGCPLTVHRRCIDPMYRISNRLSYENTMKQQTGMPKKSVVETFILDKSCWINVKGEEAPGNKNHFVPAQGEIVLAMLKQKFAKDGNPIPKLFIITPFTSVKNGIIEMIKKSDLAKADSRVNVWIKDNNIGTVHTFQGQGTDEVIFLLGCDKKSIGAANWVNKNIVNVAATRAKFRFYVIGNKEVWTCKPISISRDCMEEEMSAIDLLNILENNQIDEISTPTDALDSNPKEQSPVKLLPDTIQNQAKDEQKEVIRLVCPECGKALAERVGKYGKFIGCTGFPRCKFTQKKIEKLKDQI